MNENSDSLKAHEIRGECVRVDKSARELIVIRAGGELKGINLDHLEDMHVS